MPTKTSPSDRLGRTPRPVQHPRGALACLGGAAAWSQRGLWALLLCLLGGCTYTLALRSQPNGARWLLEDAEEPTVWVSPTDVELRYRPLKAQWVRVELEGYRPLRINLRRVAGGPLRFARRGIAMRDGREVEVLLVPDLGPLGTELKDP